METKLIINYIINVLLLLSFLGVAITGIIKFPGLLKLLGIHYTELPIAEISWIHDRAGLSMAGLVLLHLILNWNWMVAVTKQLFGKNKK